MFEAVLFDLESVVERAIQLLHRHLDGTLGRADQSPINLGEYCAPGKYSQHFFPHMMLCYSRIPKWIKFIFSKQFYTQ